MINSLIEINSKLLAVPAIPFQKEECSFFPTPTTQALLLKKDESFIIYINAAFFDTIISNNFSAVLTISHEMRHLWQVLSGKVSASTYSTRENLTLAEYNQQDAEIDAWAWASFMTGYLLKKRPIFPDFSPETVESIKKKEMEFLKEYLK